MCWHEEIKDSIAKKFAEEFFRELVVNPTGYKGAFEAGQIEVKSLSPEAARCLCFLSVDGDVNGDVSEKDHKGTGEEELLRREQAEAEQQEKERIKTETEEAKLKARAEKDRIKAEKKAAALQARGPLWLFRTTPVIQRRLRPRQSWTMQAPSRRQRRRPQRL